MRKRESDRLKEKWIKVSDRFEKREKGDGRRERDKKNNEKEWTRVKSVVETVNEEKWTKGERAVR